MNKKMSNLRNSLMMVFFWLLIYLLVTLLSSCKTSKTSCDAYSYEIKVEHCHIDEESYCYYSVDTIRLTK